MKRIDNGEINVKNIERVMVVDGLKIVFVREVDEEGRRKPGWPSIKVLDEFSAKE